MADTLDITIEQGATFRLALLWKTTVAAVLTPVDLTGCVARMQIRRNYSSATPYLTLTTENGGIALGGVNGTIDITISATNTAALSFRTGLYDIEIEFADGTVKRFLNGVVTLSPEVTRA